jgi:hypothetical protein
MVFKFAVGDAVRVVPPSRMAELAESETLNGVLPEMARYGGRTAIITKAYESELLPHERYRIRFDSVTWADSSYFWCADALEPLEGPFEPLSDAEINVLYM